MNITLRLIAAGISLTTLSAAQIEWLQIGPSPTPRRGQAMASDHLSGRLLLYGGETTAGLSDETFQWNGEGWAQTFALSPLRPTGRVNAAMAFDSPRSSFVLFGGYDGTNARAETWEASGYAWIRRSPAANPPARMSHGMAYDAARQQTLLFGGFDGNSLLADTWVWNGMTWTQRTPATNPPATLLPAMTYDSVRQRVVMFGSGLVGNETWEWDGSNWLRRLSATSPPAQTGAAIAFDPSRNRTVLLGTNETWEWDGVDWRRRTLSATPSSLSRHSLLYDAKARRIVAFGGTTSLFPVTLTAELWEFDGTNWALRDPGAAGPSTRLSPALTCSRTHTVLFGGNSNGVSLNDTWEHDGVQWLARQPQFAPAPRESTPLVYDSWRNNCVLFGGINSNFQYFTDTWTWNGSNWTQTFASGPPPRFNHAMAFDEIRGVVVLFGGSAGTGPNYRDTWTWDGTRWTQHLTNGPGPRYSHGMAFDASRGRVVLRGGLSRDASGAMYILSDTWEWDGSNWNLGSIFFPPAGTTLLSYDSTRRSVMGLADAVRTTETVEGSFAGFTTRPSFFNPQTVIGGAMAYDAVRERTMMFGVGNQTWVLRTATPASFRTYGAGCAGTNGTPSLSVSGLPWLGSLLSLRLSGARPASPSVLLHGFSSLAWSGLLLPHDLASFGAPSCLLYNSIDLSPAVTTDATGSAAVPLFVPLDTSLAGLRFYDQFATYDAAANAWGLVFTQGGAGVVGMR